MIRGTIPEPYSLLSPYGDGNSCIIGCPPQPTHTSPRFLGDTTLVRIWIVTSSFGFLHYLGRVPLVYFWSSPTMATRPGLLTSHESSLPVRTVSFVV